MAVTMKRFGRQPVGILCLVAASVLVAACGGAASDDEAEANGEFLREKYYRSLEEIASDSPTIVVGTARGEADKFTDLPPGPDIPAVSFDVEVVVSGDVLAGERLVVRYTRQGGGPSLGDGERYLLFLQDFWVDPDSRKPTGEYVISGVWAGMYAARNSSDIFLRLDPESTLLPEVIDSTMLDRIKETHG